MDVKLTIKGHCSNLLFPAALEFINRNSSITRIFVAGSPSISVHRIAADFFLNGLHFVMIPLRNPSHLKRNLE